MSSRKRAKKRTADHRARGSQQHPLTAGLGVREGAAPPPAKLSHDRRNIDANVVNASQRWRLLAASAHVFAKHGYAGATIEKITARAGVTKKTFYKFFSAKDDAFLASYEAVDTLIDRAVAAASVARTLNDAIDTIITAYLGALAAIPDLTAILLFEALAASPRIRRQRADYVERFAAGFHGVLVALRKSDPSLPDLTKAEVTLILGGVNELCVLHLTHNDAATLPTLRDEIFRSVIRLVGPSAAK